MYFPHGTLLLQTFPQDFWNVKFTDIITALVTVGLFVVYWQMKNIQSEQNAIQRNQNKLMSRQTDLMAANHQPRISRESFEGEGDRLTTIISNEGNGPAENLHVQCVVWEQSGKEDGEPLFAKGFHREGTAIAPVWNPLARKSTGAMSFDEDPTLSSSRLDEGETDVFEATINFKPLSLSPQNYEAPFSEVTQRINREWETNTIALEFWLLYSDITGNPIGLWFGCLWDIHLDPDLTLENAIKNGKQGKRIGDPVAEDEVASMMIIEPDDLDVGF